MPTIVGIRFRRAGRVYYFDPAGHELQVDDWVVVNTARGMEIGQVVIAPRQVRDNELKEPLKPVVRPATSADLRSMQAYRLQETQALARAREIAAQYNLPMKIVGAEYSFDGARLTVYFTAEGRVDFRELARDLARSLKTHVEVRQAGVRDEAKLLDGIGICGRQLCCAAFLDNFDGISIRMAKLQNLPLSPLKISGQCGRLLCCLSYEADFYREARGRLPKPGDEVETIHGRGQVRDVNFITERLTVEYEGGKVLEVSLDQLGPAPPPATPVVAAPAPAPKKRRRRRRPKMQGQTAAPSPAAPTRPASAPAGSAGAKKPAGPKKPEGEAKAKQPAPRRRRPRRRPDRRDS